MGHGRELHGIVSVAAPTHVLPPCCGAGLSQVRVRVFWPVVPHAVAEHAPQALQPPHPPCIWQGTIHSSCCINGSVQSEPPFDGGGFVHVLARNLFPVIPHSGAVHWLHLAHSDTPPSTGLHVRGHDLLSRSIKVFLYNGSIWSVLIAGGHEIFKPAF